MFVQLLSYYNWLSSLCTTTTRTVQRFYDSVVKVFSPNIYTFFRDVEFPYPSSSISFQTHGSAYPAWLYSSDTFTFTEWPEGDTTSKLPVLSMEVVDGEEVLYDLTEFVNEINVVREEDSTSFPSVGQILNAWTLSSKIVLDPKLRVTMITATAETVNTDLRSSVPLGE